MNLTALLSQLDWQFVLLGALSLSVGWGIRGNFGHEYGAAIPGALAAMAVVILSGRPDWWSRVHYFAMFGAVGWSFGGSMSYMQVIAYTHSGHPPTVLYGYANLFVIGFLWAFLGGAGIALPAVLTMPQLKAFFVPLIAVGIAWTLQSVVVDWLLSVPAARRHENPLYWYDTDWLAALTALAATLLVIAIRGSADIATELLLLMTLGWFVAFLILVNLLKLRMTPPRGDNWSGCVGMVVGVLLFCWHRGLHSMMFTALVTGLLGGVAFSVGQLIKLGAIRTGRQTNWHSVMEQTQGFLFGAGLCVGMGLLASRAPVLTSPDIVSDWTTILAIGFVLIGLTYLNHRKAALTWVEQVASLPQRFYRLPTTGWFRRSRGWVGWLELVYLALGGMLVLLLSHHRSHPLPIFPDSWLGNSLLLYVVFLWWVVLFNFERALVGFTPQRIVTEGVITLNAIICTTLALMGSSLATVRQVEFWNGVGWLGPLLKLGIPTCVLLLLLEWGLTHAMFGTQQAPHAGRHIRFGPDATATKAKPTTGQNHP